MVQTTQTICKDIEDKVWEVRNEMIGMKNVNNEKRKKITEKIMKILDENQNSVIAAEVMMDMIKFQWKFVLKSLMKFEDFKNEFYEHKYDKCIPEWLQIQVCQFKQDFENLMENFNNKCETIVKRTESLKSKCTEPKTKDEHIRLITYDLMKVERAKSLSKQRVFWSLKAFEDGCNFVLNFTETKFKDTLICKMNEIKRQVNEEQKTRIDYLPGQLEQSTENTETPKWVQKQTDKFLKQFKMRDTTIQNEEITENEMVKIQDTTIQNEEITENEMVKYCINGTALCNYSIKDCYVERIMMKEAKKRGYSNVESHFDPDSDPGTCWCEMYIEHEKGLVDFKNYIMKFKHNFDGPITVISYQNDSEVLVF